MSDDPHAPAERRTAARALLQQPLLCAEKDPDTFRLVRRHEMDLDRWFTQRLGYRLHVTSDTARLFKSGYVPTGRPLRTSSGRALHHLEYTMLVLALAATVSGPAVTSLHDLIDLVRSAGAEAGIALPGDATERRALVSALRWMINHGLALELHAHIDEYVADEQADAVLRVRPDRIALVPLPGLAQPYDEHSVEPPTEQAHTVTLQAVALQAGAPVDRPGQRDNTRQWLRQRLVEDPVVYRDELNEAEWAELRRRLGEESRYLAEMFGLTVEARAEGVAAIDPAGDLSDQPFPTGGTEGHAALLLISALQNRVGEWLDETDVVATVERLTAEHARFWAKDLVASPERLARRAVEVLEAVKLAERRGAPGEMRLLPAAARFSPEVSQSSLW